jgi:hypothetical protein
MPIPFATATTALINAENPCCCGLPECVKASLDFEDRAIKHCLVGWLPHSKIYNFGMPTLRPDAFDYRSFGTLIPLYKTKRLTDKTVATGRRVIKAKRYGGDPIGVEETFSFTATLNRNVTVILEEEAAKAVEDWPASSNYPLGQCPPEDTVLPAGAPAGQAASVVSDGHEDDHSDPTTVAMILTWTDNRPEVTYPTGGGELGDEPLTVKAGGYQVLVDGVSQPIDVPPSEADNPDFVGTRILLNNGDNTKHYLQVRHVCGEGTGRWSSPFEFSLLTPSCGATIYVCGGSYLFGTSAGNPQRNVSYATLNAAESWTSSSGTGNFNPCDPDPITLPPGYASAGLGVGPVSGPGSGDMTTTSSVVADRIVTVTSGSGSGPDPTHDPEAEPEDPPADPPDDPDETDPPVPTPGWVSTLDAETSTTTRVETLLYLNNQNAGDATMGELYTLVLGRLTGWGDLFGWGIYPNYHTLDYSVSGPPHYANSVRCWGLFGITDGSDGGGSNLFLTLAQGRYRWYVPPEHAGTTYSVVWEVGRFDDRWMAWAAAYYAWAVAKYDFLNRPEEGDDDYPVLDDFWDDPETTEVDEREASLVEAIAALPQDPGAAPEEPVALRPVIITSPEPWVWSIAQAATEPETVDPCDPTYDSRVLIEPAEPDAGDYEEPEDYEDAHAAWVIAHAAYDAAVAAAYAKSRRVSPWYLMTPTRVSDHRYIPTAPAALGDDPTAEAIDSHGRQVATYEWRLARYNNEERNHDSFRICNVRHLCGNNPSGVAITEWDADHPTTELPPLDPAVADPRRWEDWYNNA